MIDLHKNKKGLVEFHDFLAGQTEHNPDDVSIVKLKNNKLSLVVNSPHGDHRSFRIIGNSSPDGTDLKGHIREIHNDRFGQGYQPTNSMDSNQGQRNLENLFSNKPSKSRINPTNV